MKSFDFKDRARCSRERSIGDELRAVPAPRGEKVIRRFDDCPEEERERG
jgi:hypothetical protein